MERIIVCGMGQVGYRVSTLLLQMQKEVTIVTLNARSEFEGELIELGAKVIAGDARDNRVLLQAKIETADAIIACTDSDLTNIEISLDAQVLNPKLRVIARLFDQTLARKIESSVGVHRAMAMSVLAAPNFAAASLGSNVIGSFDHCGCTYAVHLDENGEVDIRQPEIKVPRRQRAKFVLHRFLKNVPPLLKWLLLSIGILAVFSTTLFSLAMKISMVDALYFVVTTLTTTGYGDITVKDHAAWVKLYTCLMMVLGSATVATLYSIITDYLVSARFDEILGRQQAIEDEHVIVIGIGNVGFRIIEALDKMGYSVVAIDSSQNAKYRSLLPKAVTFIAGDGRDEETLNRAGIHSATSVISSTHDDAINLSACLIAKSMNPQVRTVVRLFDGSFARKVERALDVDIALSASRISAPGFVGAAIIPNSVFSFVANNQFVSIIPTKEGFEFDRRPLWDLSV